MNDKMIQTAGNFQYSVNIAYDLHDAEKLRAFIPTFSSIELLEKIIASTEKTSTSRARILIGAYGKGKSHIVLTILSVLMGHEPFSDFSHLSKKLSEFPKVERLVKNYYESGKKLLPVLIGGSGAGLSQSFLVALKNALRENGLSDFMPETSYKAAVVAIRKWQREYPDVIKKFETLSETTADDFVCSLEDFDPEAYRKFEKIYPSLTAGSVFNPFLGFDVAELYESVAKELRRQKLFDGLYVVYDEFSKYLESNIESASVSDTKMLQDFAEKCCRSGENQLHLLLISHKEISNYIDKLPKQKTDGWRGISERFEHVLLNNNFSQVYEIISSVIQKDPVLWSEYQKNHSSEFARLEESYRNHPIFDGSEDSSAFYGCFPLHPVSMFVLPRLSERIAQNERTLFTFLSSAGKSTLSAFVGDFDERTFSLVTPDLIFDYFEPLFKKEVYSGEIHDTYILSSQILEKLEKSRTLERKIVKTLSLIYILAQFEKLKPLQEEIVRIYSLSYKNEEIEAALKNLIEKEFVVYLRQSNSFLKLKETSGVDIKKAVGDEIERQKRSFSLARALNEFNSESFFYPYRYNDEKEMTRFFAFRFVEESELSELGKIENEIFADGYIFAVLPKNAPSFDENEAENQTRKLVEKLKQISKKDARLVFVIQKKTVEIEDSIRLLSAVQSLKEKAAADEILSGEYQVILDDTREVAESFIRNFTHAEKKSAVFVQDGGTRTIKRRADFSELLSKICYSVFPDAPVINNEAINKSEITSIAHSSRKKILAGLLRSPLEENLGLSGSGQDVAMMRSCLLRTKIMRCRNEGNSPEKRFFIDLDFADDGFNLSRMVGEIKKFIDSCRGEKRNFEQLYKILLLPEHKIGARKGIIPIFIAAVMNERRKQLVLYSKGRQLPLNAETLSLVNENPGDFSLLYFDLDSSKIGYLAALKSTFSPKTENSGDSKNDAEIVALAMKNWYLSLPKYSRESKTEYSGFISALKNDSGAQELLFSEIPQAFASEKADSSLAEKVGLAKRKYDSQIPELKERLSRTVEKAFGNASSWCSSLNPKVFEEIFPDGTERFLRFFKNEDSASSIYIEEIARIATGLGIGDWSDDCEKRFEDRLVSWKNTAEGFSKKSSANSFEESGMAGGSGGNSYSVSFPSEGGKSVVRRFEKVAESPRARILYNKLTDALETMGYSMSEPEKRQVLMNVLQKMCGGEE